MVKQTHKSALNNSVFKTRRVYVRMYFATTQTNITATTRMSTSYFLHLYLSCKRHLRSSSGSMFAQHRFRPPVPSRHSPDSIIATIHFYCVAIKRGNCRLASIGFVDRVTSSGVTVGRWPKTPLMPSLQVDS